MQGICHKVIFVMFWWKMEGNNPPRYLEDAGNGATKLQGEDRRRSASVQWTLSLLKEDEPLHINISTECSLVPGEGGNPCDEMVECPPVLGYLLISLLFLIVSLLTNFELDGQKSFFVSLWKARQLPCYCCPETAMWLLVYVCLLHNPSLQTGSMPL